MQYHVTRMKCAITIWAIVALSMWNLSAQVPDAPYQPDAFTSLLLHFDEGKGNTARDASEFANHCIVGNVRWTKGRFGMALDFRGGGYAYVRLSPSLDVREKLTIEAWIWIDGPSDEIQRVAFRSGVYGLYISARRLTLTFFVNAGQRAWESVNAPIPAKRWVHIAGVYDGKEMRLFVDGELAGRREKSGPIVESPAPLFIGANDATGRWRLHGMIDEVRISHIARTKFDPQERLTLVTTAEFKPLPPERVKITLLLPTIGIRTCRQPPAIDGNLNDPAWRRAVRIRLRDHPFGKYLTQRTHVYVTRDADNLYVAFRCIERRMDALVAKCKVRDGDVFSDDCIELFLQPNPQVGEYFHIAVNPLGTVYDARCAPRPDKSWDSNVRVGVKKGDREWCVELAIPYRALGVSAVNEGDEWRGNFCREEKPHGELSAWAPVGGRFHQPNKFGRLKFTDKPLPPPAERVVTIRGILRDERGNRAVGVRVVTPFGEARTDALGYFTLRGMIRGRNMIAFKHPRYEPLGGIVIAKRDIEVIAPPALKFVNPYRYEFTLPSTAHGYRVYSINYLDDLDPAERPDDSHYEAPLRTFATSGEYEPLSFVIYAQRNLNNVKVQVSALKSRGGATIPSNAIDVRYVVRYLRRKWYHSPPDDAVFVSRYLVHESSVDIPNGTFRQVWLTIHVPDNAPAGIYRGIVRIVPKNAPMRKLPLELEVLPFKLLIPPHKKYSLYYYGRHPEYPPNEQEKVVRRELRDIREHGASLLLWRPHIVYRKTDGEIEISYDEVLRYLNLLREFGFEPPYIVWGGLPTLARMLGHKLDTRRGAGWEGLSTDKRFYAIVKRALEGLLDLCKRNGFGEVVITDMDEVFGGKRLPLFIELMKAVRQVRGLRIYITFHNKPIPRVAKMIRQIDPYVDIRCYHGHSIDEWLAAGHTFEELRQELERSGDEAWTYYNPRSVDVTPEWMRIINGIWLWHSPIRVHCPWIYNSYHGNPLDDADGHDYGYAFPVGDEIVPTRLWEAYREGVDDVRYLYTLTTWIQKRGSDDPDAKRALAWLDGIKRRFLGVKLDGGESALVRAIAETFTGDDYQRMRRECAEHIMRLIR